MRSFLLRGSCRPELSDDYLCFTGLAKLVHLEGKFTTKRRKLEGSRLRNEESCSNRKY